MRSGQIGGWGRWVFGLGVMTALGVGLANAAAAAPVVRRVDSADSNCPTDSPPTVYCTIQAAIDAAAAGDTVYVKPGTDGTYEGCIEIDKRINVVAGGDVTIFGRECADVLISGSRARFQGFVVSNSLFGIEITGSDNVVAANRLHACDLGILLAAGAARNLVVANVINECEFGIFVTNGIGLAGPNNQLLHNMVGETFVGIVISVSKTTLVGNVTTFNDALVIDIQQFCSSTKIKQTALSKNVAAQNNLLDAPSDFDIRIDPRSQRPVLKGNTYQTSGVVQEPVKCGK